MIPAFLLKNPLALLLGVGAIALAVLLGIQTLRLGSAQTALATEKLAFSDFKKDLAVESLRVTKEAALKSADQMRALTEEVRNYGLVGQQTKTEIRYVQSNGGPCAADPVYRATVGGVQRILDAGNPGGDKGKAGAGPTSTVRRTGASGPGQKP